MRSEEYIGDGVYASYDGFQVRVYTGDGVETTNVIYFDPTVLAIFLGWLHKQVPEQFTLLKQLH